MKEPPPDLLTPTLFSAWRPGAPGDPGVSANWNWNFIVKVNFLSYDENITFQSHLSGSLSPFS